MLGYLVSRATCTFPVFFLFRDSVWALCTTADTEIGVDSPKALPTHLTVLLMLVPMLSRLKGLVASIEQDIVQGQQALPSRIE
ncbi:hypothetical protein AP221_27355, partial [Escherichia coli]